MYVNSDTIWAVSQATPLRRMVINGVLTMSEVDETGSRGYASGGFMADVQTYGIVDAEQQQQWMSRNSHFPIW